MAVLKRIKASTLMETLVATVLIVIIFMISSMVLNTLFSSTLRGRDDQARRHLNHLVYAQGHGNLELPHTEEIGDWIFSVTSQNGNGTETIVFHATHQGSQKTIRKSLVYAK